MIDKNGKVMRMTPTKRKEFLASQLNLPKTPRGLGKDVKTKDIFTYLFKKETKNIMDTLEVIREVDPRTYLKVMVEMGKLSMAADKDLDNKTITSELNELLEPREKKVSKEKTVISDSYADFTEVKEENGDTLPNADEYRKKTEREAIPKPETREQSYDASTHPAIKEDLRSLGLPSIPKK